MKRILITPLNWGLGHATRCMPIINELLEQNAEVIIATDGRAFHLLSKEYPKLTILKLPPYNITYKSQNMMRNIAPQLPKVIKAIAQEYKAIQKVFGSKMPSLTTNKWKLGHTFGASGMLSVELAILMLQQQKLVQVPFIDYEEVPKKLKKIMVNAVGFGGNAVSVLLSKNEFPPRGEG